FIKCANEVNCGRAFAVDPFAVGGKKRPGTVEFKAAIGTDTRFIDADRIERFDRMQTNAGKARPVIGVEHTQSLAESCAMTLKRSQNSDLLMGLLRPRWPGRKRACSHNWRLCGMLQCLPRWT